MEMSLGWACRAAIQGGIARCRKPAIADGRCGDHKDRFIPAPRPTALLFSVNMEWQDAAELAEFGILWRDKTPEEREKIRAAQAAEAKRLGRDEHAIRKSVPDGGSPVFGKTGLKANLNGFASQLAAAGYVLTDVHLEGGKGEERGKKLLLYYTKEGPSLALSRAQQIAIYGALVGDWEIHVWANPVREGSCTHTVNLKNTGLHDATREETAPWTLLLDAGDWAATRSN